ncbi:MAG: tetratricopeptide repeat protein, partial [Candidatus Omnitrophica bacterium]|nr:tetratricopeptide repeat protein [Candidatus Omnitrophota bacterium]
ILVLTVLIGMVGAWPSQAAESDSNLIVVDALGEFRDAPSAVSARARQAADGAVTNNNKSASAGDFQKGGAVDVDRLLGTVNQTLSENRDLRKNMSVVQESFERLTIENNVLKSRLRNLERRAEEKDSEKAEILKDFNQRQKQIDALHDQNDAKMQELVDQANKLNDSKAEIKKLQDKLGEAILESERDEYNLRINNLKAESEQAISELAKAKYLQAQHQEELGQSYYRMGNMLFEQRQFAKAVEHYLKALEYNPQLSYAHHNLGVIYDYYLNNNPEALKHYKAFLNMEPDDTSVDKINERMLELELAKNIVPENPLKLDYTEYHKKSN